MIKRILVDHHGHKGLGDIVCETQIYGACRNAYPDAEIFSRNCRTLAWGHPCIDGFDESTPDGEFDRIFRLPNLKRFEISLRDSILASRTIFQHFARQFQLPVEPSPPSLYVLPREMAALGLEDDGEGAPIVVLSADSRELDRRWGAERFERLARHLQDRHRASIIEIGSGLSEGNLGIGLNLVGKTSVRQMMAVLSLSDLFVGNHGGLTHLAGAVGTPILTPWGASHPYWAYRYDDSSRAIEVEMECQHCRWTGMALPQCVAGDRKARTPCTQVISVEQMTNAADEQMADLKSRRSSIAAQKARLRGAARDPLGLDVFQHREEVTPFTHDYIILGGETGWANEHSLDNFSRMDKIVAFPDLLAPAEPLHELVGHYVANAESGSDWVLVLAIQSVTSFEASRTIEDFLNLELRTIRPIPKMIVIVGATTPQQRADMIRKSRIYVRLESPNDLSAGSWGDTPLSQDYRFIGASWGALLR